MILSNKTSFCHFVIVSTFWLGLVVPNVNLLADDASLQDAAGEWHGEKPNILWIMIEDWSDDLSC